MREPWTITTLYIEQLNDNPVWRQVLWRGLFRHVISLCYTTLWASTSYSVTRDMSESQCDLYVFASFPWKPSWEKETDFTFCCTARVSSKVRHSALRIWQLSQSPPGALSGWSSSVCTSAVLCESLAVSLVPTFIYTVWHNQEGSSIWVVAVLQLFSFSILSPLKCVCLLCFLLLLRRGDIAEYRWHIVLQWGIVTLLSCIKERF